jgi:NADPH2:quinone reductase
MAGEVVLVHGASGGVGTAAIQFARAAGMTVIGTAGSEKGRRLVLEEGAHHALDHGAADHLKEALALTGGIGVDVIVEFRADLNLDGDLTILARQGRVAVVGSRGRVEIDPTESRVYGYVHGCPENPSERSSLRDSAVSRPTYCAKLNRETIGREASVVGVTLMAASEKERAAIHAAIAAGLENGTLRPVVGEELPLREAARAHHAMMEQPAHGKRVLIP